MKQTLPFKGTRDISGDDMRWRLQVIDTISNTFELYGFEPLETSIIERKETLLGKYGEEAENLLFLLGSPHEDGGLRYDHTVPLARFAASNWQNLSKPYKRYAIGPVFRAENPQSGRYRQFYQCDFDTLGTDSLSVDAEIVAINYTILNKLGFEDQFTVEVNDRKLLNAMVQEMGYTDPKEVLPILRAWDKLDKVSPEDVFEYLVKEMEKLGVKRSLLEETYSPVTNELLSQRGKTPSVISTSLRKLFSSKETIEAIDQIDNLISQIESLGVPSSNYRLNPLLARGLGYYTGPIFETIVTKGGVGSITGGGRYDNLIAQMGGPSVPATGSSFGLDRLLVVMEELGLRPRSSQTIKVFITIFDQSNSKLTSRSLEIAKELRSAGISTEVFSGKSDRLSKQIEIADKKNIPLLFVIGPDELASNKISVRDLRTKKDLVIPQKNISKKVHELLSYKT